MHTRHIKIPLFSNKMATNNKYNYYIQVQKKDLKIN